MDNEYIVTNNLTFTILIFEHMYILDPTKAVEGGDFVFKLFSTKI